jgi:branched-chain amino acid transport system permease protein
MLSLFGQLIIDGLAMGLVYIMLAAGFVLILSTCEIFFIAYGAFYTIGAYAAWYAVDSFHLPYLLGLVLGTIISGLIGLISYILIFQRVQKIQARFLATITAALGLSIIMGQGSLLIFGTTPRSIPTVFEGMINVAGVTISADKLALITLGILITFATFFVYEKTKLGRGMRAVSFVPEAAALQGINANRIYMITFMVGTALAGFAGGIIAPSYGISSTMGNNIITSILLMTMLGGMDSLLGAVAGGLVIGQVLSFGQYFIGGTVQIILFGVVAIIIYFKPQGLLGRKINFGV